MKTPIFLFCCLLFVIPATMLSGQADSADYYLENTWTLRSEGLFDEALLSLEKAWAIAPDSMRAIVLNSKGKTYFDMATSPGFEIFMDSLLSIALIEYNQALDQPETSAETLSEVWANRGAVFGVLGKREQALLDFNKAVELDPANKNAYFNRSIAYFMTERYTEALDDYEMYLKFDPGNANIWYEKGMLERSLVKNKIAIKDLSKAIKLNPDLALAWLERARAHAQAGHRKKAKKDYQRAVRKGAILTEEEQKLINR